MMISVQHKSAKEALTLTECFLIHVDNCSHSYQSTDVERTLYLHLIGISDVSPSSSDLNFFSDLADMT